VCMFCNGFHFFHLKKSSTKIFRQPNTQFHNLWKNIGLHQLKICNIEKNNIKEGEGDAGRKLRIWINVVYHIIKILQVME